MSDEKTEGEVYTAGGAPLPSISGLFSSKTLVWLSTTLLLLVFGSAARGEFFLFAAMLWKNWDHFRLLPKHVVVINEAPALGNDTEAANDMSEGPDNWLNERLREYCLQDLHLHLPVAVIVSYLMFFCVGGFLQWQYYVKRRDKPEEWKCQPNRFLSEANERHEITLGACCLLINSSISGILSTYIINGGTKTRVYFNVNERGWIYFAFSTVLYFLVADGASYYFHRMLHLPFFYRNFHKWHHRYHSPTAFSAVAMHPVESTLFQLVLLFPLFLVPLHFVSVTGCFYYLYYFGLIDHSGIDLHSVWPWQPPVRFHDDHHKYFHVNFGFNTMIFDRLHGTLRRKNRMYGEDIFYGRGAPLKKID